jgi:hypothetical protein
MSKQTHGEELSDMFYALQITTKIMEGITQEHGDNKRSQADFEARWHSQSELLCRNLAKVKPLVEKFLQAGYNKYDTIRTDSKNDDAGTSKAICEDELHPEKNT